MDQHDDEAELTDYPHGRGYGHDYMRGGEVLGGYGYAEREEYERPRGERDGNVVDVPGADRGDGNAETAGELDGRVGGGGGG
ncbi:MAG: hypothetical protein ACRENI_00825 [Gemmatimonadaceae bacterium]